MSDQPTEQRRLNLSEFFAVRSDRLRDLRSTIQSWRESGSVVGAVAQFRLVIDTNVVIGDILWLVAERKLPSAKTQLMEAIEAETIQAYVPPSIFAEVEEKIPLLAAEKNLDKDLMYSHWAEYQKKLIVYEPDFERVRIFKNGADPDDAEFIALAETIAAAGVFSKDSDIAKMGGNQISIECITYLRNYSRATAIEVNIKVNGVILANVSIATIRGLLASIKALIDGVQRAPNWLKLALLAGGVFLALHPGARASVARGLKSILNGVGEATPAVISYIAEAAALAEQHRQQAQGHLALAMNELSKNGEKIDVED